MSRTLSVPAVAEPLVDSIRQQKVFTRPTLPRFLLLMACVIVTMGRHTVSRALKAMGPLLEGHWSNYHRVYSQARYSMWKLAAVLVRQVLPLLPADQPIVLLADDTVDRKSGRHVWAKGVHRDPVRSTPTQVQTTFGHKWLVMCVLVRLPGIERPWALPVLCGMCLSLKVAQKVKRRPKTAAQLARQLLMQLMRWLPERKFVLIGDYQVVTHQTVALAQRHAGRVTAIGRMRGDANLYHPPKTPGRRCRTGARARKGRKAPSPAQRAAQLEPCTRRVKWYGGVVRQVKLVSEEALWFSMHQRLVTPVRWVCVLADPERGLENAYFYSSDVGMEPKRIIELYACRWNIEVTFEETRALLGLETTRHWCERSVLRVTPLLFGLFTAVALLWSNLPQSKRRCQSGTPCYAKTAPTFADALFAVRGVLWREVLLVKHLKKQRCLDPLPKALRETLLWHLAAAA
jgi:hypothetical protein